MTSANKSLEKKIFHRVENVIKQLVHTSAVRSSRYEARGKFGEHERCVRVARGVAESNSSFLSCNAIEMFFSRGICFLTSWACTIGIWSAFTQLNLIRQIYSPFYNITWGRFRWNKKIMQCLFWKYYSMWLWTFLRFKITAFCEYLKIGAKLTSDRLHLKTLSKTRAELRKQYREAENLMKLLASIRTP